MKVLKRKRAFEKKMAEYRRFLKDDFDWDYAYILQLLRYKLTRTRQCIVANNIVASAKKTGEEIQKVEDLLGRVLDDHYYEEISKDFHKKYGQSRIIKLPHEKGVHAVPVTIRYQKETAENSQQIHREVKRLYQKAERMKINDLKKAFDLMCRNIWGWWD